MNKSGFTLIELLIVMGILGILIIVAATNFMSTSAKGRDARRKADLVSIQRSLEIYYDDNSTYPGLITGGSRLCHPSPEGCNTRTYMAKVPLDPNGREYFYCASADEFVIFAKLENRADTQIIRDPNISLCGGSEPLCLLPENTCFGLSSSNINP